MKYTLAGWCILGGVLIASGLLLSFGHYIAAAVMIALPGYLVKDLAARRHK